MFVRSLGNKKAKQRCREGVINDFTSSGRHLVPSFFMT